MGDREYDGGGGARGGIPGIPSVGSVAADDSLSSRPGSELGAKRLFSEMSDSDTETGGGIVRGLDLAGRRGRGKNLARARKFLRQREEEESEAAFDSCMERSLARERDGAKMRAKGKEVPLELEAMGAEMIMVEAEKSLDLIKSLVGKSTNLKGGYASKITKASVFLKEVLDVLVTRTEAEETRRLRADIGRLQRENAGLKEEVRAHRQQFEEMRRERVTAAQAASDGQTSRDQFQVLEANIARMVGNLVDGRLAALESRLKREEVSRPPLAGDNSAVAVAARAAIRRAGMQRGAGKAAPSPASSAPVLVVSEDEFPSLPPPPSKGKGRGKDPKRGKEVAWTAFGPAISSGSVEHAAAGAGAVAAGWTEVVRRKAPKKKEVVPVTKTPAPQPKKKAGPKEGPKKVALPRSQAVMLKLRPEAAAKGATYLSVLLRAEREVNTKELGIGPLKIRSSATGARIIEVPGSASADKADALAAKLKSVLAEEAEVSRPVKFTDVRVTGLNDATTADRLIAAVAQEGGCTEAQVRVRSVRPGPRGTGSALVEVPAAAAKKLLQLGSLSVGWSQVRLSHMEARPKHCFKCLGTGHVAAACPSPKDRSGLCYRCGKEGHKSAQCYASPRCAVCADASKPADHVMGGHSCCPPSTRGKLPAQPQRAGVSRRASGAEMSE
nr:uncharacterized protein LOC116767004 [Danaus plexippus plexippus]